jgi:hypothetical protein
MVRKTSAIGIVGHVAGMNMARNAYRYLVGKPETKELLGRTRVDGNIILVLSWILSK